MTSSEGLQFVVGIGSSAGGLEALEGLAGALEPGGRTAYVVAQHLAPEHPSLLVELISRGARLPVVPATDGLVLEPDVIAIVPPGQEARVEGTRLRLAEVESSVGSHPSIDLLLESIAESWGDHAVGVVLSGTGSDGAFGMRRIKAGDGLTVVQSPQSAKFEAMPRAILSLGVGDMVLEPAQIGALLSRLGTDEVDWLGTVFPTPAPDSLTGIVIELRRATGIDFSRYKESTLLRQVRRRMAILQVAGIDDYLPLLVADPAESVALTSGLLVTVTSFFRDREAFEALRERLRTTLAARDPSEQVRVWVPGCATGEEVYSIAMIVSDLLGGPGDLEDRLKVFGTDLDEAALAVARRGIYPGTVLEAVPPDLAGRYLLPTAQGVEVAPELRSAVVFARHNVGQDPPFPRLDLVSCRNTLIYFTPPLQRRVLEMFAYALLPGGLLFLGGAETLSTETVGFEALDPGHRIFARTSERVSPDRNYLPRPVPRLSGPGAAPATLAGPLEHPDDTHVAVLEALAGVGRPAGLVLNERHEVVEVIGDVQPFCRIAQGRPSTAAASFLRPELAAEARALLLVVRANGRTVTGRVIRVEDVAHDIRLVASPLHVGDRTMTLLEFVPEEEVPPVPIQMAERAPEFDAELDRLERELLESQASLQGSLAELETAHEELLASNEELQASSEELQSSYEELATSNEELQASNEELAATNRELQSRTDELDRVSTSAKAALADFTRVTDALREVVWQRDTSFMRLLYVSKRVEDITGIGIAELGEDASALDACIHPADRERVWASRTTIGAGWTVDFRIIARDGSVRWVAERGSVVRGVGGIDRVVGTLTDVTDQVEAVRREGQQKQVFEAVFRAPFFGVAILDADERVVMANDAFCELLDYDSASIQRMPFAAFGYPGAADDPASRASHHLVRRDGTLCWANVDKRPLTEPIGEAAFMVILRDVTPLYEQQEELARQTAIDLSTGLLNRVHFQRTLAWEIDQCRQSGTPLALVWVDSDMFKEVNDQFGHDVGDAVLRSSAERLASAVRPTDVVGRVGGDEFAVVLTGYADAIDREAAIDRMLWAIRQPTPVGEAGVAITASIGVAVYPEDGDTAEALMQAADTAMVVAKERGGNTFEYFRVDMTRAAEERRRRRAEIDRAIAGQEFVMHYQPIIDVRTHGLWGVEALIRWHRDGRVVAAGEFIGFCEESGQIRALAPLTLSLFRKDLEMLRAAGIEVGRACINLSASQLEDEAFTDVVGWWPSPTGLEGVVVEVTETAFLPEHARAVESLELLAGLGAELSVDDFGSGYSNLTLLESLAPAYIKLDRSFLLSAEQDGRGTELLSAAIQMAHALNSAVIAEGIETEEQLAAVAGLGADLAQGFAIARPMTRDDLVAWIADRTH